jgi:hypothetical protein
VCVDTSNYSQSVLENNPAVLIFDLYRPYTF